MQKVRTNFTPIKNGFKFENSFDFPDFFEFKLPIIRVAPIFLDDMVYGLCGGMCFASLDYFNAGNTLPKYTDPDDISLKLFQYLWERQLKSLSSSVVRKVFKWMILDDNLLARSVNQYEIPKLKKKLDSSQPAVLALIRVKWITSPTKNHQVLATGYDFDPVTHDMTVYIYDPNHPREEHTISMNLSKPSQGIDLIQSSGEKLRGFFLIDYTKHTPPS